MSDRGTLRIQQISGHLGPIPGEGTQREDKVCKLIDTTTCIGCKACEVACVEWNDMPFRETYFDNTYQTMPDTEWNFWNLIKFNEDEHSDGSFAWLMRKHQCMHCADPGCLRACPADGAIVQYENGIVDFQQENCIGCQFCVSGCPFNIPKFDPNTKKVYKCTLCSDRVGAGLEPACIKACPTGCLHFGTKDDMKFLAEKRATQLREVSGFKEAGVYDPPTIGGTSVIYVLHNINKTEAYGGLPQEPRISQAFTIWKDLVQADRPIRRDAGLCRGGDALRFRRPVAHAADAAGERNCAAGHGKGELDGEFSRSFYSSSQRHRSPGSDRGLRRRTAAPSCVHPFSALDGRHLLLSRAAVRVRYLSAVDLPLLHAAIRRRRDDAFPASLVRPGLCLLLSRYRLSTGWG